MIRLLMCFINVCLLAGVGAACIGKASKEAGRSAPYARCQLLLLPFPVEDVG
jgi:hypothetical protein